MRIVLATGGSGGHIFPALSVASALQKERHGILFFASAGEGERLVRRYGHEVVGVRVSGLAVVRPWTLLPFCAKMVAGYRRAREELHRFNPDVVVGFGSYASFPVVLAAQRMGIATVIHEQNVVPGRANRILAGRVDKIAISFSRTRRYFTEKKTVLTGCPIHLRGIDVSPSELRRKYGIRDNIPVILVFGGSQGAQFINRQFFEAVKILKEHHDFGVIHICGSVDFVSLTEAYTKAGIHCCLFSFLEAMEEAYALADLVVSRAGALTVSELSCFRTPAILIPYPFAGGHQMENAQLLKETGIVRILEQNQTNPRLLKEEIVDILFKGGMPAKPGVHKSVRTFLSDATLRLASEITRKKE